MARHDPAWQGMTAVLLPASDVVRDVVEGMDALPLPSHARAWMRVYLPGHGICGVLLVRRGTPRLTTLRRVRAGMPRGCHSLGHGERATTPCRRNVETVPGSNER